MSRFVPREQVVSLLIAGRAAAVERTVDGWRTRVSEVAVHVAAGA